MTSPLVNCIVGYAAECG